MKKIAESKDNVYNVCLYVYIYYARYDFFKLSKIGENCINMPLREMRKKNTWFKLKI